MPDTASHAPSETDAALASLKRDLVTGYHVLAREGLGLGLFGHLTARLPGADTYWSYRFGVSFEEVTEAELRECDFHAKVVGGGDGQVNPTLRIHGIIYAARPDVLAIAHHHGPNGLALGAIGEVVRPFERTSSRFYRDIDIIVDYDNAHRVQDQGDAMLNKLGDKRALILQHHGSLIVGRSVAETVISTIELERLAGVQLTAMAAGELREMADEAEILAAKQFNVSDFFIDNTWRYYRRCLAREKPEQFKNR